MITWSGDFRGLDPGFRAKLARAVEDAGGDAIRVTSGKRSDSAHPGGPTNHGVKNSNHLTGHAADGFARINGRWIMLGNVPGLAAHGLRSGNAPGFYKGAADPIHVDDGTNVSGGVPLGSSVNVSGARARPGGEDVDTGAGFAHALEGVFAGGPIGGLLGLVSGPADFFKFLMALLEPKNWLRAVELLIGLGLIFLALVTWAVIFAQKEDAPAAMKKAKKLATVVVTKGVKIPKAAG